jgi:hypothetical protein
MSASAAAAAPQLEAASQVHPINVLRCGCQLLSTVGSQLLHSSAGVVAYGACVVE